MILEQDCRFQTTTTYWRECMEQIQLSIPKRKPAQKDTLENRIKKIHKQKSHPNLRATVCSLLRDTIEKILLEN